MERSIIFGVFCLNLFLADISTWGQSIEPPVQQWNKMLLEAIRNDLARPNVHARNLFHFSTGQYALQILAEGGNGTLADGNVSWPVVPEACPPGCLEQMSIET